MNNPEKKMTRKKREKRIIQRMYERVIRMADDDFFALLSIPYSTTGR